MNPYINEKITSQSYDAKTMRATEVPANSWPYPAYYPYFAQTEPRGVAFPLSETFPCYSISTAQSQSALFYGSREFACQCSTVFPTQNYSNQSCPLTHERTSAPCASRACSVPIRESFHPVNGIHNAYNHPRNRHTLACSNSWHSNIHPNTITSIPNGLYPVWIGSYASGIPYSYIHSLPQETEQSTPRRKFRYEKAKLTQYRTRSDLTMSVGASSKRDAPKVTERKPANPIYEPHWTKERITAGIEDGSLLSGNLRINPKCFEDSYLKHPQGDADIYISGLINRNRALSNDLVAVQLEPKKNWRVFDTYTKDFQASSAPSPLSTPTTPAKPIQNKRQPFVKLADFLQNNKHDLEQIIGADLTEKIKLDLESSADPSVTDHNSSNAYAPWWTVIQRTARVVGIVHELHSRACIGQLQLPKNGSTPRKNGQNDSIDATNQSKPVNANWSFATLIPSDNRSPRIIIPRRACPETFQRHPESYKMVRFVARIVDWPETSMFPKGELLRSLSTSSSDLVDNETERILVNTGFLWGLDAVNNFPDLVNDSAKAAVQAATWNFADELAFRKDLRTQCIFTIDPSTARDLDDALHCRVLTLQEREALASQGHPGAVYEVGVHIADVSYFVRPESAVDEEASKRATTIYLVQLCVPMLPRILCEELCSLNAGEDKLAFSVIFTVSERGEILTKWFGRTLIRSCAKLSYEDAQYLIDHPDDGWTSDNIPTIEAPHTAKSVLQSVLNLHELAMQRRRHRFASGSLRLDQVKSKFVLDDDNKHPLGVSPCISMPSNWLVEEWMLAANEAVAVHLASNLPQTAFLRRHSPPSLKQLNDASSNLEAVGIKVDTATAGSIQASICNAAGCPVNLGYHYSADLASLCADMSSDVTMSDSDVIEQLEALELGDTNQISWKQRKADLEREARLLVALSILTKAMTLAEYFCLGELSNSATTLHYALNMELYTHFTSPIRRYADIIVHRQLAGILARSALDSGNARLASWYSETALPSQVTKKALQTQAEICNSKKLSARLAGEESAEVFFTLFVMESGPLTEVCAVTCVLDRAFDVLLLSCGLTRRVYLNNLNLRSSKLVPDRRIGGKIVESAKLCLLWNSGDKSEASTTEVTKDEIVDCPVTTLQTCVCCYTEVKLLDVVRCRVAIEQPKPNEDDSAENGASSSYDGLPKLRVILLRPFCAKCQISS